MEPDPAGLDDLLERLRAGTLDVVGDIEPHDHGEPGESLSVRVAHAAGHEIRIETRYRIFIDDQPFPDPIHVTDDGSVHYHGLPQYALPSAVALLKLIVERMTEAEPPPPIGEPAGPDGGHGGHGVDHDHDHDGPDHEHGHGQGGGRAEP